MLFSANLFSQEAATIRLDSLFIGAKVDSLNFYVEEVIDNRLYKEYLGIAQIGTYNYRLPLKFENPLKYELGDFLKRIFPFDNSKKPITIRINELFIKENPKFLIEVGALSLRFDILKKETPDVYTWLNSYSITSKRNTIDATAGNIDHLAGILYQAILIMANKDDDANTGRRIDLAYKPEPPILVEKPNNGFYYTYSELANNLAEDGLQVTIKDKSKNKGSNTVRITDSEGIPSEYFAYFDGQNFYLNSSFYGDSNYFIKTYRVHNFLLFTEDFIADDYISGYTIAKGKSSYDYVKSRRPVLFNLTDGKFYTVRRDNMAQLLEMKYPDLFKKFKKNEKKDIHETYEIIKFLFENEDPERVREILTS